MIQNSDAKWTYQMPKASPSSSTTYQVISSETIFLFGHILCILFGASFIFIFSLFAFIFNKLGWTPAFFYGRETRSAFSLEYSCASLICVEYSCVDILVLLALVLHASLVQSC